MTIAGLALAAAMSATPALVAMQGGSPAPAQAARPAAGIDGEWDMAIDSPQGGMQARLLFKVDGRKVTGTVTRDQGPSPLEGEFADGKLTFVVAVPSNNGPVQVNVSGALKPDGTLAGTLNYGQGDMAWTAARVPKSADAKAGDKPIDVNGKWTMALEMSTGTGTPTLVLKQDGDKVTGTYSGRYGEFPLAGTLKGTVIEFSFTMTAEGTAVELQFKGEVSPDATAMRGDAVIGPLGDATWTAKRDK